MIFSFDLLINAVVSGILIGGFYAAVTSGVSLSFGILDIVNIAHPAFIILGSYVAYTINASLGFDPILTSCLLYTSIICESIVGSLNSKLCAPTSILSAWAPSRTRIPLRYSLPKSSF